MSYYKLVLCAILCTPIVYSTPQAIVIGSSSQGATVSLPSTTSSGYSFSSLGSTSFRIEFRYHACTSLSSAFLYAGNFGNIQVSGSCASPTVSVSFCSAGSASLSVSGGGDYLVRISGNNSPVTSMSIEIWDSGTSAYKSSTSSGFGTPCNNSGSSTFGESALLSIDWFRWYNSTVPLGTIPVVVSTANVLDYEFDGNGIDSSGNGLNLTLVGSPSFSSTPVKTPVVSMSQSQSCFVSSWSLPNFCVTSSSSTTLAPIIFDVNEGVTLTYLWTQVSGVSTTIVSPTSPLTLITGFVSFGEYDYNLRLSDSSAGVVNTVLKQGFVPIFDQTKGSSRGLVSSVPTTLASLIGPLTVWGSLDDLFPWYSQAEIANANVISSSITQPTNNGFLSGTLSISGSNPVTLSGSGTSLTTACTPQSGSSNLNPPSPPSCQNAIIWLWIPDTTSPSGFDYAFVALTGSITNTTATTQINGTWPIANTGPFHWSFPNLDQMFVPWGNESQPSYSWNYYDAVLAYYRIYYRTGITTYLTTARSLADTWYTYTLGGGASQQPNKTPRAISLGGMMTSILDRSSTLTPRWSGLEVIESNLVQSYQGSAIVGLNDLREAGYQLGFLAELIMNDPNLASGSLQSTYCTYLSNEIQNWFFPQLNGSQFNFQTNQWLVNNSFPSSAPNLTPWQFVILAKGLREASLAAGPTFCNNSIVATEASSLQRQTLEVAYQMGALGRRATNTGGTAPISMSYIASMNSANSASGLTAYLNCDGSMGSALTPCAAGHVSISASSTTVTGVGTSFTSTGITGFSCSSGWYIGIVATDGNFQHAEVLPISACPSNTSITLGIPASFTHTAGAAYAFSQADLFNGGCSPTISSFCYGGSNPDFSTDNASEFAALAASTGQIQWLEFAEKMASTAYGGGVNGPGFTTQAICVGPYAGPDVTSNGDGNCLTTSSFGYLSALPTCLSSPGYPCGGATSFNATPIHYSKDFGIGSGWAGSMDNFFGYDKIARNKANLNIH